MNLDDLGQTDTLFVIGKQGAWEAWLAEARGRYGAPELEQERAGECPPDSGHGDVFVWRVATAGVAARVGYQGEM